MRIPYFLLLLFLVAFGLLNISYVGNHLINFQSNPYNTRFTPAEYNKHENYKCYSNLFNNNGGDSSNGGNSINVSNRPFNRLVQQQLSTAHIPHNAVPLTAATAHFSAGLPLPALFWATWNRYSYIEPYTDTVQAFIDLHMSAAAGNGAANNNQADNSNNNNQEVAFNYDSVCNSIPAAQQFVLLIQWYQYSDEDIELAMSANNAANAANTESNSNNNNNNNINDTIESQQINNNNHHNNNNNNNNKAKDGKSGSGTTTAQNYIDRNMELASVLQLNLLHPHLSVIHLLMHSKHVALLQQLFDPCNRLRVILIDHAEPNSINPEPVFTVNQALTVIAAEDTLQQQLQSTTTTTINTTKLALESAAIDDLVFTFSYMLSYANRVLPACSRFILTHSDIILGRGFELIHNRNIQLYNSLIHLSRYGLKDPKCQSGRWGYDEMCRNYIGSHDTIIAQTPINSTFIAAVEFSRGRLGSENLFLAKAGEYGLRASNPCFDIFTYHAHCSNLRVQTGYNQRLDSELGVWVKPGPLNYWDKYDFHI